MLVQDVSQNTFGGTTEAARNIISGNNFAGIALVGIDASENLIQGSFVGTDLSGTIALPNRGGGVSILDSPDNILGGIEPGAGNLFSGNDQNGVTIYNVNATGNVLQGNLIGTDLTGSVGLGNGLYGVIIEDAPDNTIGGTTEAARNIISGNDSSGIVLLSRSAASVVSPTYHHQFSHHRRLHSAGSQREHERPQSGKQRCSQDRVGRQHRRLFHNWIEDHRRKQRRHRIGDQSLRRKRHRVVRERRQPG